MPVDIPATIQTLQDALLHELGGEVELIFRYGSRLKGEAHAYSDLDLSYTPAHESTWRSITVLVGGVMVDLYPIHWSTLDDMANFRNLSAALLFDCEVVYQRDEQAAQRFQALPERLRYWLQPEQRPEMLRRALEIFQGVGYPYYLLREQAAQGNGLACLQSARQILGAALHCLAVCNQAPVDTRKLDQVLALPRLPCGLAQAIDRLTGASRPGELLAAVEALLDSTRQFLLTEQRQVLCSPASFREVFAQGYPEFKNDLQHILLACERQDRFRLNVASLCHELMVHLAKARAGIECSSFHSLADTGQDLAALGFPDLLEPLAAGDFSELSRRVEAFDARLRALLQEQGAALNDFATLDDLQAYLRSGDWAG